MAITLFSTDFLLQTSSLFRIFLAGSLWAALFKSVSKRRELNTGMRVIAMSTEMINAKEIVRARSRKRMPAIPGTKRIGRKTTRVVRVDTTIGVETSCAPLMDDALPSSPSSLKRKIFSRTTTALSTTIPTARVSPDKEIIFRLTSETSMMLKVAMMEIGMVIATINAVRPLLRKRSSMMTTRITA